MLLLFFLGGGLFFVLFFVVVVLFCFCFVFWLTSQQLTTCISGKDPIEKCTYCHSEIEVMGQTCDLTESQYADAKLSSPSPDPTCQAQGRVAICVQILKSLV